MFNSSFKMCYLKKDQALIWFQTYIHLGHSNGIQLRNIVNNGILCAGSRYVKEKRKKDGNKRNLRFCIKISVVSYIIHLLKTYRILITLLFLFSKEC